MMPSAMPDKLLTAIPKPMRDFYEKGNQALQRGNLDYALTIFTQVLASEPGFLVCRQGLRTAQMKKSGAAAANTGFFRKVLGGTSNQPQIMKAQLTLRKDPGEAMQIAEEILNKDPLNNSAHKIIAEAALAMDFPRTAIISLEIVHRNSPDDREVGMQLAEAHSKVGQNDRAEAVYQTLVKHHPTDPELTMALKNLSARTTMAEGGYDALSEGKGSYRDIMRDKSQATALEQENRVVKTGDVADNLIAEYSERLAQEPGNLKLLRNLAELHTQKKEFDQALAYYQQIRSSDSGGDPTLEKAVTETQLKKFDHIKSQLDPNAPDYPQQLAALEKQRADFQVEECKSRADRYPTDLGIRFEMGELYFKAGRIGEAIAEFQKAQSNPAKRLQSMSYLGQCFARRNMNDLAARTLQNAIKEKPNFDDEKKELVYSLGCVLEKMNKAEEAIEQFKTIYEMDIAYRDVAAKVDAYYAAQGG